MALMSPPMLPILSYWFRKGSRRLKKSNLKRQYNPKIIMHRRKGDVDTPSFPQSTALHRSSNKSNLPNLQLRLQTARPTWQIVNVPNRRSGIPSQRYFKLLNPGGVMQSTGDYNESKKFARETRKNASTSSHHYDPKNPKDEKCHQINIKVAIWFYETGCDGITTILSCRWKESRFFVCHEKPAWHGLGSKPGT